MNYRYLLFLLSFNCILLGQDDDIKDVLTTKLDPASKKNASQLRFDYSDTLLTDILNEWGAATSRNILLPQGAQAIKTKITYKLNEYLSPKKFEDLLVKILDIVGYTIKHQDEMTAIIKNDQQPERQSLDIYISTPLRDLPNNEQMITYVYYLDNLSIKVSGENLKTILADILSKNAKIVTDDKSNALIITDKSNNIQSGMKIIIELDQGGLRDAAEVIPVYYTSASLIEDLFKKLIPQQKNGDQAEAVSAPYFPRNTKILSLDRTNSLVIMGTTRSINIVKEFIIKYIDLPLESGRSVLHIYDLQYLKAEDFAPILQNMVKPSGQGSQSTGKATGPNQYFKDVIVAFERYKEGAQITPSQVQGNSQSPAAPTAEGARIGGNKLIIAARHEDWIRIERLIQELDKPQLQVALEVLIIDLTLQRNRSLGSQLRNKRGFNNSTIGDLNFQSAQLASPVLTGAPDGPYPANALAANLLQLTSGQNIANNTSITPAGSFVFSLEDKSMGVWNVWTLLNQYAHTTILSQPFLVTKNKEKATVTVATTRLLPADTESSTVSALTINYDDVTAGTTVDMLPTISKDGTINLLLTVQVNEFISASQTTPNRLTRIVQTNANVGNGEILALGGLTKTNNTLSITGIPILSSIPLVGWWFTQESKTISKSNLLILIQPTIIQPYTPGGVNAFTAEKLALTKHDIDGSLTLDNLRDPITRWFFQPDYTLSDDTVGEYVRKTDELRQEEEERRRMRIAQVSEEKQMQEARERHIEQEEERQVQDGRKTRISFTSKKEEKKRATQLAQLVKDENNPLSLVKDVENEIVFNT